MAYIKVDHSKFETAAKAVDDYVDVLNKNMNNAQRSVDELSSKWQGKDYIQFKTQFNKIDDSDSVHKQFVKSLKSYSKYLRFAADKYKNAQINAVNRANNLPRY